MRRHPRRLDPLGRYCRRKRISFAELGRRAGLSRQYVADIASRRCRCGAGGAYRIQEASGGEIRASDLIAWSWKQKKH